MAICLSAIAITGCQDDIQFHDPTESVGEPVTVTLQLSLPEMTPQSRADISDDVANEVTDIWVGIFDASGKLTGSVHHHQSVNQKETHRPYSVTIDTKTGPSHIVAIANAANNNGVMLTAENADSRAQTTILDLLNQKGKNLTWSEFLSLAYLSPQAGSIETPNGHIPMCGVYYDDSGDPKNHPTSWESLYNQTIDIPADGKLNGHIHLRRLMSQVKVQLQTTGNIIDIEPYSWQVINVPRASWLLERNGDKTNATDAVTGNDKWLDNSPVHGPEYFPFIDKVKFDESGKYVQDGNNKAFVFDFWQTENKRTIACSNYKERESAARTSDVTYIELKCRITYKTIPENSSNDQYLDGGTVSRTADATYIIPLGGINDVYSDFNHRRNSRYIYNVTISDVTQILVEAHTNQEQRPGVEGIVTDLTNPMVHLDAHYSVMNISLTKKELMDACPLDENGIRGTFRFRMDVYDKDNTLIRIDNDTYKDYSESTDNTKKLYVNWIEIRPTTDKNTYALYQPISDSDTKYIYQFGDYLNDQKWAEDETRWFTVFINEYTYETDNKTTNWKDYVNKDERKAWFIAEKYHNVDQTSVHFKAKYGLSQKSIQTYYNSEQSSSVKKAIGVEHFNETIGARLRWDGPSNNTNVNGKINAINYCSGKSWSNYVTSIAFDTPEITNQGTEPSHPTYLPKLKTLEETPNDQTSGFNDPSFNDPDKKYGDYYVGVVNACMNRNRDLNGDGIISTDEIRWYVPTARQYQRIILGRNSLSSPIMQNFNNIKLYASSGNTKNINNNNTRYHLASSDRQNIWAEEGLSRAGFHDGGVWQFGAWQVRCIRNLGTDDSASDSKDIEIRAAYKPVENKRVFEMDRYDSRSVRNNKMTSQIPIHHIYNQEYNRIYSAFEYAENDIQTSDVWDNYPDSWSGVLMDSMKDPCKQLNDSQNDGKSKWRVPNQKEITMMFYAGVLDTSSKGARYHYYISATHEFFDYSGNAFTNNHNNRRYLGIVIDTQSISDQHSTAINFGENNSTFIRCVRDVDPDEYPDDITVKP